MTEQLYNLPKIKGEYKFNEPLKKYTWLNVGGPAEVMFFPKDEADLQYFLQNKPENVPVFVIGCGSNLLVRDGGVKGVVVKLDTSAFSQWKFENNTLCLGCGLKNAALKNILLQNKIGGLEFICSIPGSVGGLVRSNAGCFGGELSGVLQKALVIDGSGKIFEAAPEEFNFGYRYSNFPADWILLRLYFKTVPAPVDQIAEIIDKNAKYRQEHQPYGVRTAGSTFKNPANGRAWEFIKNSGGCELHIGGASFAEKHCNFMINDGSACAADLENLGEEVRKKVYAQTGVNLEWEVKVIGEKNGNAG